jgi:hypothetical protein
MKSQAQSQALASLVDRLAETAELEDDARTLVDGTQTPREFLESLREAELFTDAIRFLAHLLPRREAVWWAWMAARKAAPEAAPEVRTSLHATEHWIRQPGDAARRAAMRAAEAATLQTPAGCAGLAAFLSGGSIAPDGQAEVPPPPTGTARAVYGSLVLAAVLAEPSSAGDNFRELLGHGIELADRIELWDSLARAADHHV